MFHLVFWHEQYVAIARALLEGERSRLVTGSFKQANARAVETNRADSINSLLARLAAAQAELSRGYPAASGLTIALKAGAKARPYDDAMARVKAHVREHLRKLKRQEEEPRTVITRGHAQHVMSRVTRRDTMRL